MTSPRRVPGTRVIQAGQSPAFPWPMDSFLWSPSHVGFCHPSQPWLVLAGHLLARGPRICIV